MQARAAENKINKRGKSDESERIKKELGEKGNRSSPEALPTSDDEGEF